MDAEPDVIRQDIEQTRDSLAKKVESLEEEVKGTIENVKETVEGTIESVKEKVQDTVQTVTSSVEETVSTVKRTFDIPHQVEQHPWAMAGCSLLAGMATGYLLGGRRASGGGWGSEPAPHSNLQAGYAPAAASSFQPAAAEPARAEPQGPGLLSSMLAPFESEISKVKETAIGILVGLVRDKIKEVLPPNLAANVDEIMNSATRKAGGEPIRGPVLPEETTSGLGGSRPSGFNH